LTWSDAYGPHFIMCNV